MKVDNDRKNIPFIPANIKPTGCLHQTVILVKIADSHSSSTIPLQYLIFSSLAEMSIITIPDKKNPTPPTENN